jgi:DNA-binding NarL/FixJ family response regulator
LELFGASTEVVAEVQEEERITAPLTSRERDILQLIAEGETTQEIAWRLGLSTKTVKSHRIELMRKLDIDETAALIRYAIRHGRIRP